MAAPIVPRVFPRLQRVGHLACRVWFRRGLDSPGGFIRYHDVQSSLYQHVKEGHSDSPCLPMDYVCNNVDQVCLNVDQRKGELRSQDVRNIVTTWKSLQKVKAEVKVLEDKKTHIGLQVKSLVQRIGKESSISSAEFKELRNRGREIRLMLTQLYESEVELEDVFYSKALLLPNTTHPMTPVGEGCQARVVELVGEKPEFDFQPKGHLEIGEKLGVIRQKRLSHVSGHRSYYLSGAASELEHALVHFAMVKLKKRGFIAMSVPDMIKAAVFEGCGIRPNVRSSLLYKVDPDRCKDMNLAGTSEVGIAGYFMDHAVKLKDLPIKVVCCSTCYRAETDNLNEPWGLYRVHHFSKVEMFGVTAAEDGTESEKLLQEFVSIQKEMYSELGLHFRVMEMPTADLGLPAFQKFDAEAWMAGRQNYGEISSASNCTDYQSRRLHIMYKDAHSILRHVHTVNGTAVAVPRLLIAILENNQMENGNVRIPKVLQHYLDRDVIVKPSCSPQQYIGPNQYKRNKLTEF